MSNQRFHRMISGFACVLLTLALFGTAAAQNATPVPVSSATTQIAQQFGPDITVEQTLHPGANYDRYIVSYLSDGLKIYALMTIPRGDKPATGWPIIVFNHGYIRPSSYVTTGSYVAQVDALARHDYIIFKSDYRGNGNSQGSAFHSRSSYVTDVLNAIQALKQYPDADSNRIGMWGHSMGGYVTMGAMLKSPDIKASVIWAGTLRPFLNSDQLKKLAAPIQLQHSMTDPIVPYSISVDFADALRADGLYVELYLYQQDDHDIAANATTALTRSIYFFDKYVKNLQSPP
jgi:dipeptidyl aminopeptidase/acylaminoacyl peptidase